MKPFFLAPLTVLFIGACAPPQADGDAELNPDAEEIFSEIDDELAEFDESKFAEGAELAGSLSSEDVDGRRRAALIVDIPPFSRTAVPRVSHLGFGFAFQWNSNMNVRAVANARARNFCQRIGYRDGLAFASAANPDRIVSITRVACFDQQ